MSDSVKVTNLPDSGSKERVALDLARAIAVSESGDRKDRAYWLDLYAECLQATSGYRAIT